MCAERLTSARITCTLGVMSTDTAMTGQVAEEILAVLGRRRMNKSELARRLGVSHTWVTNRLSGDQEIGVNELQRIAAILGVTASDLVPRNTVWKSRAPLGERVLATVGEDRKARPQPHRPGRPVRQTRPIDQKMRPMTAIAAGR